MPVSWFLTVAAKCELLSHRECNTSQIAGYDCIWMSKCVQASQVDMAMYEENMCPQSKILLSQSF